MPRIVLSLVTPLLLAGLGSPLAGQEMDARRTVSIPHVLERLAAAIAAPMPDGLDAAGQRAWTAQTEWLETVRRRVEAIGVRGGVVTPRDVATGRPTGRRASRADMDRDLDALRQAVEAESRRFTTLSNVMKARHDVAMNSIRNMKA